MIVWLLTLIAAVLLFGRAAVRSAIAAFLAALGSAFLVFLLVTKASQVTPGEWGILVAGATAMAIAMAALLWWQSRNLRRREASEVWAYYEKRGLLDGDDAVRTHAQHLLDQSDNWALDHYCAAEEQRKNAGGSPVPPTNEPVDRVWSWFATDVESRFGQVAREKALELRRKGNSVGLDRHCRAELARLAGGNNTEAEAHGIPH